MKKRKNTKNKSQKKKYTKKNKVRTKTKKNYKKKKYTRKNKVRTQRKNKKSIQGGGNFLQSIMRTLSRNTARVISLSFFTPPPPPPQK